MRNILLISFVLLLDPLNVFSIEPDEILSDSKLEKRPCKGANNYTKLQKINKQLQKPSNIYNNLQEASNNYKRPEQDTTPQK